MGTCNTAIHGDSFPQALYSQLLGENNNLNLRHTDSQAPLDTSRGGTHRCSFRNAKRETTISKILSSTSASLTLAACVAGVSCCLLQVRGEGEALCLAEHSSRWRAKGVPKGSLPTAAAFP